MDNTQFSNALRSAIRAIMPSHQPLPRSNFAAKLREFPSHAGSDADAFVHRGQWSAFFAQRIGAFFDGRIILDIGCFDAAFLSEIAAEHPQTAFIGIDWKCQAECPARTTAPPGRTRF